MADQTAYTLNHEPNRETVSNLIQIRLGNGLLRIREAIMFHIVDIALNFTQLAFGAWAMSQVKLWAAPGEDPKRHIFRGSADLVIFDQCRAKHASLANSVITVEF